MSDWKDTLIEDTELSTMTRNSLRNGGYYTLGDVALAPDYELLRCQQLGRKSLDEIREHLQSIGQITGSRRRELERQLDAMKARRVKLDADIAALEKRLA